MANKNKFIESKMLVPKYGELKNYIHTPVTKNGEVIGVVTNAEEKSDDYLITFFTWNKPVLSYTDNGGLLTVDIG